MSSRYISSLSAEDRQALFDTLLRIQNGNCFICEQTIDPAVQDMDPDHIVPLNLGGRDDESNLAATHISCNRSKQASDLREARIHAKYDTISNMIYAEDRSPNLGDILHHFGGSNHDLRVNIDDDIFVTSFSEIGETTIQRTPILTDKHSNFRSMFLDIPIEYLHHDDHINPRSIGKNLRKLLHEFYMGFPQLHIALGWIDTDSTVTKVKIFDGQHKAAAQILLGCRRLPVRVFINPDKDKLLTANTRAGTTLRQVAFDKSVQRSLGSSLMVDRMNRYRQDLSLPDDDASFSENDLVNHFPGERREVKKFVIDWVRNSVTTHQDNKLKQYIDYGGRGADKPLSYSTVEKTFYYFLISNNLLNTPIDYLFEEGKNPRQLEIDQLVKLMNIIAEKIFIGNFDTARGTRRIEHDIQKGVDIPEPHLRAFRMAKEEIMYNWLRIVVQIVQNYFNMTGTPVDEKKLFQYEIPDQCWTNVENFITSLMELSMWVNRNLSTTVFGAKQNYDFWQSIFETGNAPNGTEVLPRGINFIEMIQ